MLLITAVPMLAVKWQILEEEYFDILETQSSKKNRISVQIMGNKTSESCTQNYNIDLIFSFLLEHQAETYNIVSLTTLSY